MNITSLTTFNVPVFAGDFRRKKNNYLLNKASEADFFAHSLPHLDPAYHNNLIYAIDDEFLASIFPSELVKKYANADILPLVRGHHTYSTANPILLQILEVSDIWSALKEKRPYKRIFSDSESLKILYERANNGDFDKSVVDSLARAIKIKL